MDPGCSGSITNHSKMKYVILIHESAAEWNQRNDPAQASAYWGAYTAYGQALAEAGILRGCAGLQPPATATTLRLKDGQRLIQDGPFADTKEQLGGFYSIDVADLDAALEWAARCPAMQFGGLVEVRPEIVM